MIAAVPNCLVTGWQPLVDGLDLPDPADNHVLAAAIRCGAQIIVTHNLTDFPADVLGELDVEAHHPDLFVLNLLDLDPGAVLTAVSQQQKDLKRPPMSLPELLDTLERQGLVQTVAALHALLLG